MNKQIYRYILLLFVLSGCIVAGVFIALKNASDKMQEPDSAIKEYGTIFSSPSGESIAKNIEPTRQQMPQQQQKQVLGASATPSASPSRSPSPSPSPTKSPTPIPTASPTPSPTPTPLPENACFTISSDTVYNDTYYYGKPLNLDANCSENGTEYVWYFDGTKISPTGQKITYTPPDQSDKQVEKKEFKLEMKGKSGGTKTNTKEIKIKSVPYPVLDFSANKNSFALYEQVTFSSKSEDLPENPIQKYEWTFRGQSPITPNEMITKEVNYTFPSYASTPDKTFKVSMCVFTKLGVKACKEQTFNSPN